MEIVSLVDPWEKQQELDHEEIQQAFDEELTFFEAIEYLVEHNYDFSCFVEEDGGHKVFADYGNYEYESVFDKSGKLVSKSRHPYMA